MLEGVNLRRAETFADQIVCKVNLLRQDLRNLSKLGLVEHMQERPCLVVERVAAELTMHDDCIELSWLVQELDQVLIDAKFPVHSEEPNEGTIVNIGRVDLVTECRDVHAGYTEVILRRSFVRSLPSRVVNFLIQIPKCSNVLEREHHDSIGWHYHYLDHKKRRSDLVLCWGKNVCSESDVRPLMGERHAESKARFQARLDLWGYTKRKSVFDSCEPDLRRWPLNTFRSPGGKAEAVWPQ
jgi:hypothetical protein